MKNCQDAQILASSFKVIPLKKKVIKQIFLNLIHLNVPYLMSVSKNTLNRIGCCACLGDMMGQTYSIYACTGTNITCVILSLRYILLQLMEAKAFKVTLGKKLDW